MYLDHVPTLKYYDILCNYQGNTVTFIDSVTADSSAVAFIIKESW